MSRLTEVDGKGNWCIAGVEWGNHECRLKALENEVSSLRFKIENELEPRIASVGRAYDNYVTNPGC